MVFSVVMYGCESWTIKKAESQRMDAFELWCWRRLLRVPWTARRSNQSTLKEISPEIRKSLKEITHWKDWWWSWNSNTLATWCKVTHLKRPWCWERLKVGGEGDDRGSDGWMASPTRQTWVWASLGIGDGQRSLACCIPWGNKESDTTEWLNWTETPKLRKDDQFLFKIYRVSHYLWHLFHLLCHITSFNKHLLNVYLVSHWAICILSLFQFSYLLFLPS